MILGQKPIFWNKIKTNGNPPCPRYYHTMNYFEKSNFLIVHGGRNDILSSTSALDDTYVLDLTNFGWMKIILYSNLPDFKVFSRYGHKSTIFLDKLIILGGVNNSNYIGSSLFIVNLDFNFPNILKTSKNITFDEFNNLNENESKKINQKLEKDLQKYELGIISHFNLPPIK